MNYKYHCIKVWRLGACYVKLDKFTQLSGALIYYIKLTKNISSLITNIDNVINKNAPTSPN